MESSTENNVSHPESVALEEYLGPPRFDILGVVMVIISSIIAGFVSGVIFVLLASMAYGKFSLDSGASPLLLVMLVFFGLTLGNFVYYYFVSRIWPDTFSRWRTALSQIAIASILLYILFAPTYLLVPHFLKDSASVLIPFWFHILFNSLILHILIGIISLYRYSVLVLFASVSAFLLTGCLMVAVQSMFTSSSTSLFLLLGLVIVSQMVNAGITFSCLGIYAWIYRATGFDPVGSVFSRIESEEKELEQAATEALTRF